MTGSLCASTLAAYLPFAGPDMRYVYKRQVQRSSWFTFDKIAKVKGLSNVQTRLLADVVRRPKIQRPSQVLASIRLFESVIDQALDAGWISDAEISHLEKARIRLLRTSRPWDGKNRRQFEREAAGAPRPQKRAPRAPEDSPE